MFYKVKSALNIDLIENVLHVLYKIELILIIY